MRTPSFSPVTLLVLLPVLAWRARARIRRAVGRQRLSRVRPWIALVIFPALILLLCFAAHAHVERLRWLAGGLSIGSLVGIFGLSKTRFEPTPEGLFYTPNAHLGIVFSLLVVARVVYRIIEIYTLEPAASRGADAFAPTPLTLAVFGLLAGYYIAYAIGLVHWRSRTLRAERRRGAPRRDA